LITPLKKETKPKNIPVTFINQIISLDSHTECHNPDCGWEGLFKSTLFDYVNVEKPEIDVYCPGCGHFMFSYAPAL
jgi:hypothetical protein